MTVYTWRLEIDLVIDSPRSPAQIRNALVNTDPSWRKALKAALRSQLAKDPTGDTKPVSWHIHTDWYVGDERSEELELSAVDIDDGVPSRQGEE